MNKITISEIHSEKQFNKAIPFSLLAIFSEFIKEDKWEEFLRLLPELLEEQISGSFLCNVENKTKKTLREISDSHPEDPEIEIAEILEQEIVIFD